VRNTILVLTTYPSGALAVQAMRAGAAAIWIIRRLGLMVP
jgi:ActR/RegA family two-component response regulator